LISNNEYGYCSLLKATDLVIDKLNTENYVFTHKTEKFRVDTPMWDRLAVREAVINAIVHNDYTREVPPKFEIFSDRLEITSYGTIPNGMTEDEFFSGVSLPRNKELMRVFRDVEMVEALGSGMPIILRKYTRKSYEFMTHFIRLTFSAIDEDVPKMSPKCPQNVPKNVPKNVTINVPKNETQKRREMIVNLIRDNNEISLSAIAKNLELNVKTVKRELAEMRHMVQHVGPTRGGHWEFL
jgi:predicted HTH transcriptional regulator